MSQSLPQYGNLFPNALDNYIVFTDVNANNQEYVDLYYQYMNQKNYDAANQVIEDHNLQYVIINAKVMQQMYDMIMSIETFVSSSTFYEKIGGIVKDKGDYNATVQYELWNIVYYNGLAYMVTGDNGTKPPIGTLPTVTTYFKPVTIRGESGTGMSFYKTYSSSQNYVVADCVPYANRLYVCIQAHANKQPDINPDYWQKIITIPQGVIWSKTQPEDQDTGNIWNEINDTDASYITHVKQDDLSYKTYYPRSNANFILCTDATTVQAHVDNKNNPHNTTAAQVGAVIGNGYLNSSNDLNTVTACGVYRFDDTATNTPPGVKYSQLLVLHGAGDTVTQIVGEYNTGKLYSRSEYNIGVGSPTWTDWRFSGDDGHAAIADTASNAVPTTSAGLRNIVIHSAAQTTYLGDNVIELVTG